MKARFTATALAVLVAIGLLSGCNDAERAAFAKLSPADQERVAEAVIAEGQAREAAKARTSRDCNQAIDRHWGGSATAKRIAWRESRNNPSAVSPSGTYRGCMQMGLPLHNNKFTAVGCSPSQWANPDCNIKAAKYLHSLVGWSAWTTY